MTINDLVNKLKQTNLDNFPSVLNNLDLDPNSLEEYESWSEDSYTRNCVSRDDKFEVILICWKEKQHTPVHDHGGARCWVYQFEGTLLETRYDQQDDGSLKPIGSSTLGPGDLTFMDDTLGYHCLENKSGERARTLHIYANPIDQCEVFNDESGLFETKELTYDTAVALRI